MTGSQTIEWKNVDVPMPICGARRGKKGIIPCEYPPGHDGEHIGRNMRGWWYLWSGKKEKSDDGNG